MPAARYIAIPKADWFDVAHGDVSTRDVICEDPQPIKTGLLDSSGTPLYRVRETIPFGFVNGAK